MGEVDEAKETMRLALIRAGIAPEPLVERPDAPIDLVAKATVEAEIEEKVQLYCNTALDRIISNRNMLSTVRNPYL
jgi:hypothetical protein